ncbi:MAG: O-antigen ligase family protein [Gammaproteobacteria bacterium]|nr:O-antigen ligase family protein [Gammaproteobacteria bacterium]
MLRYAEPVLAVTTLLLLCTKNGINYPLIALALIGLVRLARAPRLAWTDPRLKILGAAFLALWLPMLASLPGAVHRHHSLTTTLDYLHFYFAAAALVIALPRVPGSARLVRAAAVAIACFWVGDALFEYLVGHDLFGYRHKDGWLVGVFYPTQLLGLVLAGAAPFVAAALDDAAARWRYVWLAAIPYLAVIALSAKRSAWTMLVYAAVVYFAFQRHGRPPLGRGRIAVLLVLGVLIAGGAWWKMPMVRTQAAHTAELLRGDMQSLDAASSYRISIWRNAARLVAAHPLTGVGPRGFRYAYREVAAPDDFWLQEDRHGQTHPHQMLVEVVTETGLVGLAGYVAFWACVLGPLRRWTAGDAIARGWWSTLVVVWLPLNMHLAFYGSYWSSFAWTALALALASGRPGAAGDVLLDSARAPLPEGTSSPN